jgi:hypothetical protein
MRVLTVRFRFFRCPMKLSSMKIGIRAIEIAKIHHFSESCWGDRMPQPATQIPITSEGMNAEIFSIAEPTAAFADCCARRTPFAWASTSCSVRSQARPFAPGSFGSPKPKIALVRLSMHDGSPQQAA